MKERLMKAIGFLKWVNLDVAEVNDRIGSPSDPFDFVAMSPDVHDLHIAWRYANDDTRTVYHEMVRYHQYETFRELVEREIGDDCWDSTPGLEVEDIDGWEDGVKEMKLSTLIAMIDN